MAIIVNFYLLLKPGKSSWRRSEMV